MIKEVNLIDEFYGPFSTALKNSSIKDRYNTHLLNLTTKLTRPLSMRDEAIFNYYIGPIAISEDRLTFTRDISRYLYDYDSPLFVFLTHEECEFIEKSKSLLELEIHSNDS